MSARLGVMPHYMELGARVSDGRSPGRCDTVELRQPPATTKDPMTDDRMALGARPLSKLRNYGWIVPFAQMIAIAVSSEGRREIAGLGIGPSEADAKVAPDQALHESRPEHGGV